MSKKINQETQMEAVQSILMKKEINGINNQKSISNITFFNEEQRKLIKEEAIRKYKTGKPVYRLGYSIILLMYTGMRIGDADGKISLNQQKPSKHAGLRRFGPEKFLQRNNEFMKERPIFYKKPIKTEKDFSTWLRCFYYTTKAVITEYTYF